MHHCTKPILTKRKEKKLKALPSVNPHVRSPGHQLQRCITSHFAKLQKYILLFCTDEAVWQQIPMRSWHTWARANGQVNALILKTYNASQMEATPSKHCTQRCREPCFITPFQHKRCFERHQQTLQMSCIIGSITIGAHGADPLSAG